MKVYIVRELDYENQTIEGKGIYSTVDAARKRARDVHAAARRKSEARHARYGKSGTRPFSANPVEISEFTVDKDGGVRFVQLLDEDE